MIDSPQVSTVPSMATLPAILVSLALPVLIYIGNPAIALLVGAAVVLVFDRTPFPAAATWGKYALQAAIVLLGLKLNPGQLLQISADYSLLVSGYVLLTLALGLLLGRVFRNETGSSQLLASGTAICGGTAIATSSLYGEEAATVATTVKLGRTLWLIPVILVFSIIQGADKARLRVPGFILFFIAAAAISPLFANTAVIPTASMLSKALLCVALLCIGMEMNRQTIRQLRGAALLQGVLLWMVVVPVTLALALNFG